MSDDLQVVCISCDPMFALRAWADAQGYFFPLLSDHWPHGVVTRAFGVLNERTGAPIRGTFLVGRDGIGCGGPWSTVRGSGATSARFPPRSQPSPEGRLLAVRVLVAALSRAAPLHLPQCPRSCRVPTGATAVRGL